MAFIEGSKSKGDVFHKFHVDSMENKIHIESIQDVEDILNENHDSRMDNTGKKAGDFQHVGTIPNIIISKWLIEDGINIFDPNHMKAIRRKLDDPDYRYLRTGGGRLGR